MDAFTKHAWKAALAINGFGAAVNTVAVVLDMRHRNWTGAGIQSLAVVFCGGAAYFTIAARDRITAMREEHALNVRGLTAQADLSELMKAHAQRAADMGVVADIDISRKH